MRIRRIGTSRRSSIRQRGLSLLLSVALMASAMVLLRPVEALAAPVHTVSIYEHTVDTGALTSQGCTAGTRGATGYNILDFGRPAYSGGVYGTIDFNGDFVSTSSIRNAVEAYADGWYGCSGFDPTVIIAMGTTNFCQAGSQSSCSRRVTNETAAGADFAAKVTSIESYMNSHGYASQEVAAGAMDAEPGTGYDPNYTSTGDFTDAYNSGSSYLFLDFGSADPGFWSNDQLWRQSYRGDDFAFPEIYGCCHSGMVQDWLLVDDWAKSRSKGYVIAGVTSDYNSGNACQNYYTSAQSWSAMLNGIQNDSNAYYQSSISALTILQCNT